VRRLALGASFLLAFASTSARTQPDTADVALVIDSDSPVAQGDRADRLRDAAVAGLGAGQRVAPFQLTEHGITAIPDLDPGTLRDLHFELRPRQYSGVSMTISEAAEILRRNEPVLQDVVQRACGDNPGCAGLVHAAAEACMNDIDAITASKVRALGDAARAARARTIVLMTAGWPSRPGRVRLDDLVRTLASAGSSLVVWKLPSAISYGGLVSDAADVLATRLRAQQVPIRDEHEAEQAGAAYADAGKRTSAAAVPAPATDADPRAPSPGSPPTVSESVAAGVLDATLRRAVGYVASFERTFAAVMWRERYQQDVQIQRRFNASGGRFTMPAGRRVLDSELLLLWLPADASWIAVRDVTAVDGVARPETDRPVSRALGGPPISITQLKQFASENGRFNIGRIVHTFNEPTFAMLLLDDQHRHRFAFKRMKRESLNGRQAVAYDFDERARPTLIKDRNRDVPAHGTLWVDESTGQVLKTLLELEQKEEGIRGTMTVRYGARPPFDVLVPVEMREAYVATTGEEITTVATYSNFRRFETAGRIIIPQ